MRNTLIVGGICVLVLVIGVWLYVRSSSGGTSAPASETATETEIPVTTLDQGTDAASYTERKNYAIYEPQAFATFWKKVHGANAKVPSVDFSKQFVIAVFAGTKPSGGYSIGVTKIAEAQREAKVLVTITVPGAGCAVTQAQTEPYAFAVVSSAEAFPLTHVDETVTKDCK